MNDLAEYNTEMKIEQARALSGYLLDEIESPKQDFEKLIRMHVLLQETLESAAAAFEEMKKDL